MSTTRKFTTAEGVTGRTATASRYIIVIAYSAKIMKRTSNLDTAIKEVNRLGNKGYRGELNVIDLVTGKHIGTKGWTDPPAPKAKAAPIMMPDLFTGELKPVDPASIIVIPAVK
jgi:hypothetical protein